MNMKEVLVLATFLEDFISNAEKGKEWISFYEVEK